MTKSRGESRPLVPIDPDKIKQGNLAIFEAAASLTAAVVIRGTDLATGICVQFRDHTLISTARHAVSGVASEDIYFIPRPPGSLRMGSKHEVAAQRTFLGGRYAELPIVLRAETSDLEDLALLEVPRGTAEGKGFRFYQIGNDTEGPKDDEEIIVGGFPFELGKEATHTFTGEHGGAVFPNFEWQPVVSEKYTAAGDFDPNVHFLIRREREPADGLPEELRGMSGAGVWRPPPPVPRSAIWRPDRIELLGIQIAWAKQSGLVKCTRLGVLTDLLKTTFQN